MAELADPRKMATLVAFAATMAPVAVDEAIEVFDLVVGDLVRTSGSKATRERLRTLKDLDEAALALRRAWLAVREAAADPARDVRAALDSLDTAAVDAAAATVGEIAREPDEDFEAELLGRYATIRRHPELQQQREPEPSRPALAGDQLPLVSQQRPVLDQFIEIQRSRHRRTSWRTLRRAHELGPSRAVSTLTRSFTLVGGW